MAHRIELIDGSSTDPAVLQRVRGHISPTDSVMVVLDSDHSREHVYNELRCYGPLVTKGQYLIVADTVLGHVDPAQTPTNRSKVCYPGDEPLSAVRDYLRETDRFQEDEAINGKLIFASSPGGYLKCVG
jgi:cephalosporin hydroxylase